MGFFGGKGKGKAKVEDSFSHALVARWPLVPATGRARRPGDHFYLLVHRARYHWEFCVAPSWPDLNLPHGWHLDSHNNPVPTVSACTRGRDAQATHRDPEFAPDLRNWEVWFAASTTLPASAPSTSTPTSLHRLRWWRWRTRRQRRHTRLTPPPADLDKRYQWQGYVREWVSVPPVWLGATLEQEAA